MRTISEMYRRSGGTCWTHKCSECAEYSVHKKQEKCGAYPGEAPWKGSFVACKFFRSEKEVRSNSQMSIFDFI